MQPDWPLFLINAADAQTHSLDESPLVPRTTPVLFRDWDTFRNSPPPSFPRYIEKYDVYCEDNAIWPLCNDVFPDPRRRQLKREEYYEEAYQRASARASKSDAGNPLLTTWAFVMAGAASLGFIMITAIVAFAKWGGESSPPAPPVEPLAMILKIAGVL